MLKIITDTDAATFEKKLNETIESDECLSWEFKGFDVCYDCTSKTHVRYTALIKVIEK